ncbi:MAG: ribose 5-phosphate isomerase B [Aureliella sp.]
MRIFIGSDHRGVGVKAKIIAAVEALGHEITDVGTHGDESVDYPDYAKTVCEAIVGGEAERGILICGTGIGMAIAANKYQGIRAANCYDEVMAEICRRHNNVNVLCLPGDLIGERSVDELVSVWLDTDFESGRHERRIEKIVSIESLNS